MASTYSSYNHKDIERTYRKRQRNVRPILLSILLLQFGVQLVASWDLNNMLLLL